MPGFVIYDKNKQINALLQDFLENGDEEIGKSLFSYANRFFWMRFHGYTVISLPEKEIDPPFLPASKVMAPFGFEVMDVVREAVKEEGEKTKVVYELDNKKMLPQKTILFSCKPNEEALCKVVPLLKKRGIKTLISINLTE